MAGAFQTVELKIPVSPEVNASRLNATVGVFRGMAQRVAGLFGAQKFSPTLDAGKLNAQLKAAQGEVGKASTLFGELGKAAARAGRDATAGLGGLEGSAGKLNSTLGGIGGLVKGAGFAAAGAAVLGLGKAMVQGNAEMEQYSSRFTVMLGSVEKAQVLMDELKVFGEKTPYEFPELARASSSLLAFGFGAAEIQPELQKLGDIASGVGTDFNELSSIYGKARIAGTLMTEDINQLTERGIPVIQEFAKQLGVSEGEVKKMASEGRITFPMLQTAFTDLTAEGGKFNGMMEAQSQTFTGMMSTVQDVAGGVLRELGGPLFAEVKTVLGSLTTVLQGPEIQAAVQSLGGAIGGIMKVVGETIGQVLPLVLKLIVPLADLISNILGPVGQVLGVILGQVANVISGLLPPLTAALDLIGGLVSSILLPLVPVIQQIMASLTSVLTPIFSVLSGVFAALAPVLEMVGQLAAAWLPMVLQMNPLVILFQLLGPILEALAPPIIQLVTSLGTLVTTLLGALLPVLVPIIEGITKLVGFLVGGLGEGLAVVIGFVAQLAADLVTLLADGLTAVINGIVDAVKWIGQIGSQIGEFLSPVIQGLTSFLGFLYDMLAGAVIGVLQEVFGWFQTLAGHIMDVVNPAIDFLSSAFDKVVGAVSGVIDWISNAITNFLRFTGVIDGAKSGLGFFAQAVDVVKRAIGNIELMIKGAVAGFDSLKRTVAETWAAIKDFRIGDALSAITSGVPKAAQDAIESGKAITTVENNAKRMTAALTKALGEINAAGRAAISQANLKAATTADQVNAAITPVVDKLREGFNSAAAAASPEIRNAYASLMKLAKTAAALRVKELETAKKVTTETTKAGGPTTPKKPSPAAKTELQIAKEKLDAEESRLSTALQTQETQAAQDREKAGRAATALDELNSERAKLKVLQEQLAETQKLLKFDQATGTFNLKLGKGETKEDAQKILNDALDDVNAQLAKVSGLKVKLLPEMDPDELADLQRQTLELDIQMGTATPLKLEDFIRGDIARLESEFQALAERRKGELADLLAQEIITQEQHDEALTRVMAGGEKDQMALRNRITQQVLDLKQSQYDRELDLLERRYELEDELRQRQADATAAFVANMLRAADNLGNTLVTTDATAKRAQLDRERELDLVSEQEYEAKKTQLEQDAATARAGLEAAARGRALEAERQAALEQMEIDQQRLKDRQAVAQKAGDLEQVANIGQQLDQLGKDMDAKGSVLLGVGAELQGSLTDLMSNLFSGDPEAIKNPFRQIFSVLAGALQQLASAKITEALLGMINGITGLPGVLLAFASRPIIEGLVNAVLTPVLSGLLSFPTGGRVDAPTLALLGDASRLGGRNTEWIFRDDQLQELLQNAVTAGQGGMVETMQDMAQGIWAMVNSDVVARGTELVRVTDSTRHRTTRRIINPNRGA